MAEPLINNYRIDVAQKIARMIKEVFPEFDAEGFIDFIQPDYDSLALMDRGKKISAGLKHFLPNDFKQAVDILLASVETPVEFDPNNNIATFLYMPHVNYVASNGLNDFDTSMAAHYVLTQKFTSEFGVRPFIQKYPEQCIALFDKWTQDPNLHVRRLVSEGTRTRLPWASRLPEFIKDPQPVLTLLNKLKDDTELYVRRSVANNLNDIGKDHPDLLAEVAKEWLVDASKERTWLVKHALRSAIKRGEPGALSVLGYGEKVKANVFDISIMPRVVNIGQKVNIAFELQNIASKAVNIMVDFAIHFVKANGKTNAKVFKLKAVTLKSNASQTFSKSISLRPMTTRTLYPGIHKVEVILNGEARSLGQFELVVLNQ